MRYSKHMKNARRLNLTLCATLALGSLGLLACDKAETNAAEAPTTEVAKATPAAATLTAAKTVEVAAAEHATHEGACEGAEGEEHSGADCMKKSDEMGEGMGCNQWDKAAAEIGKQEIPADASWAVLKVEGMTCGGCEQRIIANVGKLEGVVAVEADSELGQVRVAVAKGNKEATDLATAKITELGYSVQ
jgi:copper chaperone CopZ